MTHDGRHDRPGEQNGSKQTETLLERQLDELLEQLEIEQAPPSLHAPAVPDTAGRAGPARVGGGGCYPDSRRAGCWRRHWPPRCWRSAWC